MSLHPNTSSFLAGKVFTFYAVFSKYDNVCTRIHVQSQYDTVLKSTEYPKTAHTFAQWVPWGGGNSLFRLLYQFYFTVYTLENRQYVCVWVFIIPAERKAVCLPFVWWILCFVNHKGCVTLSQWWKMMFKTLNDQNKLQKSHSNLLLKRASRSHFLGSVFWVF